MAGRTDYRRAPDSALLPQWKGQLLRGLEDDGWQWDWTTRGALAARRRESPVRARVVAKQDGIWAAAGLLAAVRAVSEELGGAIRVKSSLADGAPVVSGMTVAEWRGPARLVLALERPFLNLASYACGIATGTRELVDELGRAWAKGNVGPRAARPPRVTATRKNLPGYRDLAVHAVRAGGGHSHRVSLSGGVLIKENHVAAAGGIGRAIRGARDQAPHGLKIEIEVRSLAELGEALAARADAVLLDNFTPARAREAVRAIRKSPHPPVVELSGGIRRDNIADYAIAGVDVISSGALTHSVRGLDLSLLVD